MPDTDPATAYSHRRAHDTVRRLRKRLTELGLPEDQVRQILPVSDIERRTYVRLGTLTVDSAEKLLAALGTLAKDPA